MRTNIARGFAVMAASIASLLAAGLLATPLMAAAATAQTHRPGTAHGAQRAAAHVPLSAQQLLTDRHLHALASQATGSVSGVAQSPDGQPLAAICVVAYGSAGERFDVTGANGRYFIPGLEPGIYRLHYQGCGSSAGFTAKWYGAAAQRANSRPVVVGGSVTERLAPVTLRTTAQSSPTANVINSTSAAATARSLSAALGMPDAGPVRSLARPGVAAKRKDGRVSGVVTAAGGRPLKGICVTAVSDFGYAQASTRANGRYRTAAVPAGSYVVFFEADCGNKGNWQAQVYKDKTSLRNPTGVKVAAGKTTTGIDAVLKPGGEISGLVTNAAGKRLGGICVEPERVGKGLPLLPEGVSARGVYHLRGMPSGSYLLAFIPCPSPSPYAAALYHNAQTLKAAKLLRLKAAQILTGINEVMPIGAVITGTVNSAVTAAPLAGICVFDDLTRFGGTLVLSPATTNSAGHYKLEGLPTGFQFLEFQAGCGNNGDYLPGDNFVDVLQLGKSYPGIDVALQYSASVSGTVTSAATGKPVEGVCVRMYGRPHYGYAGDEVTTKPDGTYVINNQVPPGTYYLVFLGGCGNTGSYAPQAYDSPNVNWPAPVKVGYGQALTGINAAMQPGATITGAVTSSAGKKLSGICVNPVAADSEVVAQSVTADGRYQVANLPPGHYQVLFSAGCGNSQQNGLDLVPTYFGSQGAPPFVAAGPGTTSGIGAMLPAGGAISGKVRTASGHTVDFSCVYLTGLSGAAVNDSGARLAGPGSYKFTGVAPGYYTVTFQPSCFARDSYDAPQWYKDKPSPAGATTVRIRAGHTVAGISAALVPGGSIAGQGGQGVCVYAQSTSQFLDYGAAKTNTAGSYVIRALNPGRYEVEFQPCKGGAAGPATVLPRLVTVRPHKRSANVNLNTPPGDTGAITGTILGGSPAVAQAGICVDAYEVTGLVASQTVTGPDGTFTLPNLFQGYYVLYYNDQTCTQTVTNLVSQWYPDAATRQSATEVHVTFYGHPHPHLPSVTLATDGVIAGTVTGAGSKPLPGICVAATSSLAGAVPVYAVTASNGDYSMIGMQPGTYVVEFRSGCGASGYNTQWWDGKGSAISATPVSVAADTTTSGISATLQK